MVKIKVKQGGCGIKYTDEHGNERHALKTAESGAFECDEAQAARLVGLGVAVYVDAKEAAPAEQTEAPRETEKTGKHLDAADLEKWDYNALKALAADMGVVPTGKKKADYIAAIVAVEVEPGDEDDGNELPDLSVADPE